MKETYTAEELAEIFKEIRADEEAAKREHAHQREKEAFQEILSGKTKAPAVEKGKDRGIEM